MYNLGLGQFHDVTVGSSIVTLKCIASSGLSFVLLRELSIIIISDDSFCQVFYQGLVINLRALNVGYVGRLTGALK